MHPLISFISSTSLQVFSLFSDKKHANQAYRQILPSLKLIITQQGRSSKKAEDLLKALSNLAPYGARRGNFKRRYVNKLNGWRELPDDPHRLPYGVWH